MYWNYLKSSLRNLLKNKLITFINVTGFSIGLALFFIIVLWITYEWSYDRFHENSDRIYRVVSESSKNGNLERFANTPAPLGPALKDEFPEVGEYTRCAGNHRVLVTCNENQYWEDIFYADANIFKIFSFSLKFGNPEKVLSSPQSVVISERIANKYFIGEDPIRKSITIGRNYPQTYTVTGIIENMPSNSQFQIDFLLPFNFYVDISRWKIWNYETYILLNEKNEYKNLHDKLPTFLQKYQPDSEKKLHLQPFIRIHLFSDLRSDLTSNVYYKKLLLYAAVALVILLLASVNFINLNLAKSTLRNKEIGIRKVIGANREQLKRQFISESLIITVISFLLAIPIIYFFLPVFNKIIDKDIAIHQLLNYKSLCIVAGFLLLTGFLNGLYPAFILSSYNPVGIFKGVLGNKKRSVQNIRHFLIVFQFAVAVFFIVTTLLIKSQLNFIKEKDLGFDKEHVIILPVFYNEIKEKSNLLAEEIQKSASVKGISFTSYLPTENGYAQNAWWEGMKENSSEILNWISADENFIDLMGIKFLEGRNFNTETELDKKSYIINESTLSKTGWEEPIGKQLNIRDITEHGEVIGVVEDFNFKPLYSGIAPVAIKIYPDIYNYLYIKTMPNGVASALKDVEKVWADLLPGKLFEYTFLDNNLYEVYNKEVNESRVLNYISLITILIAGLGILGLSSLLITKRIKEIGIRKVNGAKVSEILAMLNKDFVKWVIIAFVVAMPIAYYAMNKWLENFAYKTSLSWWIFALAGLLALGIALLTVSWQSWRAATRNPVEALRYE